MYGEAVKANIGWVNAVLVSGALLALVIVLYRLTGVPDFKWGEVTLPTERAWIVFAGLTIAHAYVSFLLFSALYRLSHFEQPDFKRNLFLDITSTGGLFVRGLLPRTRFRRTGTGEDVYEMALRDPTSWLAIGVVSLVAIATFPPWSLPMKDFVNHAALAVTILWINWKFAATWIVGLSSLAIPDQQSPYIERVNWINSTFSLNTAVALRGPLYASIWYGYQLLFCSMLALLLANLASLVTAFF